MDPDSALLQLPDNIEIKVKVDADHSEIVKFNDRNIEPYTTAIRYLKKFEEDAGKEVPQRFRMLRYLLLDIFYYPLRSLLLRSNIRRCNRSENRYTCPTDSERR